MSHQFVLLHELRVCEVRIGQILLKVYLDQSINKRQFNINGITVFTYSGSSLARIGANLVSSVTRMNLSITFSISAFEVTTDVVVCIYLSYFSNLI